MPSTIETFAKYRHRIFIETGSLYGDGIRSALRAGYEIVHSIELSAELAEQCRVKLAGDPRVRIHTGDSAVVLDALLSDIGEPCTFWLDGHYSGGVTAQGTTKCALLGELDCIARHPVKTHTLLIDDLRLLGTDEFDGLTIDEVIAKVRAVNPEYKLDYEDGYVPRDILVAHP